MTTDGLPDLRCPDCGHIIVKAPPIRWEPKTKKWEGRFAVPDKCENCGRRLATVAELRGVAPHQNAS
jgi:DNA-directed RNA polymerase subunit RPC12/RpoP